MPRLDGINSENSGFTIKNQATNIEFAGIRPQYFFPTYLDPEYYSYTSRYSKIRRIQDKNDIFHETYKKYEIPESSSDIYITVDNSVENRLDIISCKYYQSPIMWWIIRNCK